MISRYRQTERKAEMEMRMILNRNLRIESDIQAEPVKRALAVLKRDIEMTCLPPEREAGASQYSWTLRLERGALPAECFRLEAEKVPGTGKADGTGESAGQTLKLTAGDEMGFVYGIYEISRSVFGVKPFWFWNDQQFVRKQAYSVPEDYRYESEPFAVKLRGWFVNDEILIHKWKVNRRSEEPWEMVFEALLRCGGNMVIPGTDKNALKYRGLASAMGLAITHHHAEPLGADMFGRVYPDLTASYEEYPEKFQALWKKGIEDQKAYKVIWNLGFRGQGDRPFWEDDPRYQTDEARGKLMSSLIRLQYDMVKEAVPDAVCCTNLYGETMELYRDGYLDLPEDVIKIWADNGYGKMVSRRQMNHNPRIPALPSGEDHGRHGIYYHVSFYDLQAANQLTMCANSPEFIERELEDVISHGADDYWIVNCSNVKPHVYYLDLVAEMWKNGKTVISEQRERYVSEYYGAENAVTVGKCLADYPKHAIAYGPNEDDRAGEQFVNHVPRMLVSQFMADKNSPSEDMIWAADLPDLAGQVRWFRDLVYEGAGGYRSYLEECRRADADILKEKKSMKEKA